jgi:hypothetical protein
VASSLFFSFRRVSITSSLKWVSLFSLLTWLFFSI